MAVVPLLRSPSRGHALLLHCVKGIGAMLESNEKALVFAVVTKADRDGQSLRGLVRMWPRGDDNRCVTAAGVNVCEVYLECGDFLPLHLHFRAAEKFSAITIRMLDLAFELDVPVTKYVRSFSSA